MKTFLVFACLVGLASSASAQDRGRANAVLGVTLQGEADAMFGGEVGANVHPNLEVYGGLTLMRNVLPSDIREDIDTFSNLISTTVIRGVELRGEIRAITGVGGLRFRAPTGLPVRPYVLAGVGLARLNFKLEEAELGDVLDDLPEELLDELGIQTDPTTKPFVELGAGLEFPVSGLFMDAGYRYGHVLGDVGFNISRVYFGIGAKF